MTHARTQEPFIYPEAPSLESLRTTRVAPELRLSPTQRKLPKVFRSLAPSRCPSPVPSGGPPGPGCTRLSHLGRWTLLHQESCAHRGSSGWLGMILTDRTVFFCRIPKWSDQPSIVFTSSMSRFGRWWGKSMAGELRFPRSDLRQLCLCPLSLGGRSAPDQWETEPDQRLPSSPAPRFGSGLSQVRTAVHGCLPSIGYQLLRGSRGDV